MKNLFIIFGILFTACAVQPHKPVDYRGKPEAIKPYVQLDRMATRITDCNAKTHTCEVNVEVNPWIHNPTKLTIVGYLTCTYELNDYESPSLHSKELKLGPKQSMNVDMSNLITVPGNRRSNITVGCFYKYRRIGLDYVYKKQAYLLKKKVNPKKK